MNYLSQSVRDIASIVCEIEQLPGVVGSMVYTSNMELLYENIPKSVTKDNAYSIVRFVGRICGTGVNSNVNIRYMESDCSHSLVITMVLRGKGLFTIFCEKEVNKRLVRMISFTLREKLEAIVSTSNVEWVDPSNISSTPKDTDLELLPEPVVISHSLVPILDIIKEELRLALRDTTGTNTENIMSESIAKWAELGPVRKKELPVLASILCERIYKKSRRQRFLRDIEDLFIGYGK
jgi:hypothetical protein